jgi:hypothetical protein
MTTTATKLLNFDAVEKAPLTTEPFSFMVAKDVIPADMLARVNADYPHIDRPANFKPESLTYGPLFAQVLEDLAQVRHRPEPDHQDHHRAQAVGAERRQYPHRSLVQDHDRAALFQPRMASGGRQAADAAQQG